MYTWQTAWQDYYQTLGLARDAAKDEIHRAWRRLSMANGVDRLPPEVDPAIRAFATVRQKEINAAKDTLLRPGEKADYDQEYDRRAGLGSTAGASKNNVGAKSGPGGKEYHPIFRIAGRETGFSLKHLLGETAGFKFTVFHDLGELPPVWKPVIKFGGSFLDAATIAISPKNAFPMTITVSIPCSQVGTEQGYLEFFVVEAGGV
jgi:hypothetical protein